MKKFEDELFLLFLFLQARSLPEAGDIARGNTIHVLPIFLM